jgi:hypothetical protein
MGIMKVAARVRGYFAGAYAENKEDEQLIINPRGDLVVVQALPELAELVRMGDSWGITSTTGQAALTARPTTTSGLSVNNNEPATGKSMIIDSFGSWEEVVDATQSDITALFAMVNKRGSAQASSGTAETGFNSLNGKAGLPSNVAAKRGATVANDVWFPHATEGAQMAAAAAGSNWKINLSNVRGQYIVPPTGTFSVQAVKAAAAAAAQQFFFIKFHMVQLPVTT